MNDRLPTELWISAHLRQCTAKNIPIYVVHKGALASGTVLVRIVMKDGSKLLSQTRDLDGNMGWMDPLDGALADNERADQYIQRVISRDPDVWVIEVEDNSGKNPFEGKIF